MRLQRDPIHSWLLASLARRLRSCAAAQAQQQERRGCFKQADVAFRDGFCGTRGREPGSGAERNLPKSFDWQPQIAEGHEALGTVLVELGKPLEGAREFEAAAKLKPGDDGIETNLALAYSQAGEPAKAIPHFDSGAEPVAAAGARSPSTRRSTTPMVVRWPQPASRTRRRSQFVAEESLTGPRADLEDAIGTLYAQQAKWQEAQERFEHAIALDGSFVRARIHLGVLYRAAEGSRRTP